ncbi:unnamed protein product [Bursaphelenchus okinawaensis]|uniref:Uncharacterized protein n=1 Tax=Bursaphelenchus okinawaensis TaxID=465554 RepID=A0A811K0C9_9BILA|nr:unnamed protein product [Bursaphelenchus okinawaensis]CAG9089024.1 unnamed protein product [Bursaphelenchus okinawaensis]
MNASSSNTYQHLIDLTSKCTRKVINRHFDYINRPNLEIVQIRQSEDQIQCRCLHKNGKSKTFETNQLSAALKWLSPLIHNAEIRLLVLMKVKLCEVAFSQLAGCLPFHIKQLSMTGVDFLHTSPITFENLLNLTFKADRYLFGCVRNVASAHFNSQLLDSKAFVDAEMIDIDVLSFQEFSLPCLAVYELSLINWFFNCNTDKSRTLISNRLCLGPFFLAEVINTFKTETKPKPAQMVLCGRIVQCTESYKHLMFNRNGKTVVAVRNNDTLEELVVAIWSSADKVEITRKDIDNNNEVKRLRPVGQAVR